MPKYVSLRRSVKIKIGVAGKVADRIIWVCPEMWLDIVQNQQKDNQSTNFKSINWLHFNFFHQKLLMLLLQNLSFHVFKFRTTDTGPQF